MTPLEQLLVVLVMVAIGAISYAMVYRRDLIERLWYLDKHFLTRGTDKPTIWLFLPASEVNSRSWLDFGQRSSRALQIPLLNLCYQSIAAQNGDYHIRVISGVAGLAELLGQDALPPSFQRFGDLAPIGPAERNWIRAAVLARFGGLWLSPSVVALRPFGSLPDAIVFFGTDPGQMLSGPKGTAAPSEAAMWVPRAGHPVMVEWEAVAYQRVAEKRGGEQFRGDWGWDVERFAARAAAAGTPVVMDPHAELSRGRDGKRLQLEDLFAAGTDGRLPFDVPPHAVYCPIPWEELQQREAFGWVLRMSEEQVMESDLAVRWLLEVGALRAPRL